VLNFEKEAKNFQPADKKTLGIEQIRAPEIMFQPKLGGFDDPSIVKFTYDVIMKCDEAKREGFFKHIVLSGGNTMFPGFDSRFDHDMKKLKKDFVGLQLTENRENLVARGGAIMASLSNYCGLSRAQWNNSGIKM